MPKSAFSDREMFNSLMQHFPDTIYFKDTQGKFVSINQKQADILGVDSIEEVVGKTDFDFFPHNQAQQAYEDEQWIIETGNAIRDKEERVTRADGSTIWMSVTKMPIRNDEGEIVGIMGISRDITARKTAIENSEKQYQLFQQLFKNSPVGIVFLDEDQLVRDINESFRRMFGYNLDEISGQSLDQFIVPEEKIEQAQKLTEHAFGGKLFKEEATRLHKNGSRVPVLIEDVPVRVGGEIIALFAMYIDISERKKYQEKIENNLREKRTLLEEIHHRVKNNLAILSGLLQLKGLETEDPTLQEILQESQSRIQSMALVHEKFYEFDSLAEIELRQYTKDLVETLRQTLTMSEEQVQVNLDADKVHLDIHQAVPLGILLNEILTNAFKYAFPDGEEGEINIDINREGNHVSIQVQDNGVGLPEDLDMENSESLGIRLMHELTDQLEASFNIDSGNWGTAIKVEFEI